MATKYDISVDHDIWTIGQKFNSIKEEMDRIQIKLATIRKIVEEKEVYDGRGQSELYLFIVAYEKNVDTLASYYALCNMYISEALASMMEFDKDLQDKFKKGYEAYELEHPEQAEALWRT